MKRCLSLMSVAAWCLWLMLLPASAMAEQPRALELFEGDRHYLNPSISLLVDPGGQLTIEDILKPEVNARFSKPESDWLSFGFTSDYKWLKVVISYPDGAPNKLPVKEWFLEVARIQMNVAELYMIDDAGHIDMMSADMRKPFEKRAIKHVHSVFPVKTELGQTYTLYLRLAKGAAFYVPITLWTPEAFIEKTKIEQLLYGMFYGGMLVMILYNVFVYYSTGDRNYLRYIAYLICVTLFEFVDLGHGINLIPGGHQYFNSFILPGIMLTSMVIGINFARHFLEFPTKNRFMDRCILTWMIIVAINIPSCFLLRYNVVIEGAALLATLSLGIIAFMSLYAWWQKNENAVFFTIAWAFNMGGFMVLSGMANGHLEPTPLNIGMAPLGVFMEAVMFSFVLAERIKRIERAELNANERAVANLRRFRSVFDNALEGIFQMSLKGRITAANRSFLAMVGLESADDAIRNTASIRQMLFPEPVGMLTQLAEQGRLSREVRFRDGHDRDRLAQLNVQLIRRESGEPSHIEGTFVDFTDRLERDKMQRERLRERRERQLARQATDEKTQFLKSISYEIRTPLSAIMGFSETLKLSSRDEPLRKLAVEAIMRNSTRLLRLINDILDFSKLEAGKMAVEQTHVQLADWLEDMQQKGESLARQKAIGFDLQVRYPLPDAVTGDSLRLRQLVENLLLHAIDVTDEGRVLLEVGWDNGSSSLSIACSDEGPAFSDRQRRRMFQSFDDSDTVEGRTAVLRSGLGTVIASQLTRLMGGSITSGKAGERGNRIDVTLPLRVNPGQPWLTQRSTGAGARQTGSKADAPVLEGTILLAEDNAVNQQLIQRIIRKTGASVVTVSDGQQALEAARKGHFQLILMDVNMPVMGGLEATSRLRANGYPGPIYALTAEQAEHEIQACLDAGCNGHLGKPIELDKFYSVLTKELSSAGNDLRQTGLH